MQTRLDSVPPGRNDPIRIQGAFYPLQKVPVFGITVEHLFHFRSTAAVVLVVLCFDQIAELIVGPLCSLGLFRVCSLKK